MTLFDSCFMNCAIFQNSLLDKDGSTFPNNQSPSACREPLLLDTTPRLIVTAPSTAASTPADSRSIIQFIDEEADNNSQVNIFYKLMRAHAFMIPCDEDDELYNVKLIAPLTRK